MQRKRTSINQCVFAQLTALVQNQTWQADCLRNDSESGYFTSCTSLRTRLRNSGQNTHHPAVPGHNPKINILPSPDPASPQKERRQDVIPLLSTESAAPAAPQTSFTSRHLAQEWRRKWGYCKDGSPRNAYPCQYLHKSCEGLTVEANPRNWRSRRDPMSRLPVLIHRSRERIVSGR